MGGGGLQGAKSVDLSAAAGLGSSPSTDMFVQAIALLNQALGKAPVSVSGLNSSLTGAVPTPPLFRVYSKIHKVFWYLIREGLMSSY